MKPEMKVCVKQISGNIRVSSSSHPHNVGGGRNISFTSFWWHRTGSSLLMSIFSFLTMNQSFEYVWVRISRLFQIFCISIEQSRLDMLYFGVQGLQRLTKIREAFSGNTPLDKTWWARSIDIYECTNRCSLAAGLQGNEERMRKWRGNGDEMERKFPHSFLYILPLYPFPISKFVTFCRKMLNTAFLSRMSQKLNIRAMRKLFWAEFSARKLRKLCRPDL